METNDVEMVDMTEEAAVLEEEVVQPEVPKQKQKMNIYTVMLILSFVALLAACILLMLELGRWGDFPWWNTSDAQI